MKLSVFCSLLFIMLSPLSMPNIVGAIDGPLSVTLVAPSNSMVMGESPVFVGRVANRGETSVKGLIVYPSLVSLKPGKEQPVDLEDWSARPAVRIDLLSPGELNTQQWPLRLIESGKFAMALTVIAPTEAQPAVSVLVPFEVQPKRLLAGKRVLPVAIGVPSLLLLVWALVGLSRGRFKFPMRKLSEAEDR